jgi:hypothetical protein
LDSELIFRHIRWGGGESFLVALPDKDSEIPIEEQIEKVVGVVGDVEPKVLPNNDMPPIPINPVHRLFDVLTGGLEIVYSFMYIQLYINI